MANFGFKMARSGLQMANLGFQRSPGQELAENGPFAFMIGFNLKMATFGFKMAPLGSNWQIWASKGPRAGFGAKRPVCL